jgi:mannose-6-phosphate isomerase-like protein (cupin superfamily)
MNILKRNSSPRYVRDGIESFLLVSEKTCGSKNLVITLVEMQPGGLQQVHNHKPEQVYYILEGSGVMTVGSKQSPVKAGDCVLIPSFAGHGLKNAGAATLRYLSVGSPSFTAEECEKLWPLGSLDTV